jgi:2-phospho-L-lactate guanylyltransferase
MIAAIVLAKPAEQAKGRLSTALPDALRESLARGLLLHVLDTLDQTGGIDAVYLVGNEAVNRAVRVVTDPGRGMNGAAAAGIAAAELDGANAVLLLPADLPLLTVDALNGLIARLSRDLAPMGIISPDRARQGTNALLLAPPTLLEPSFGPGSFARHVNLARRVDATVIVHEDQAIAADLDTPDDLWSLPAAAVDRLIVLGAPNCLPTLRRI